MKGIYLGACRALHTEHNLVYQDINGKRDIGGDMLDVDISRYDPQIQDFRYGGVRVNNDKYNQGGTNVHTCLELWIRAFEDDYIKR